VKLYYLYVRDYGIRTEHAMYDGHFELLNYMVRHKIVDEADAVLDIYRVREEERIVTKDGVVVRRRNGIDDLKPNRGDVIWVRGAWKPWLPWIRAQADRHIWLMFYDANTGRKTWPFWDVVVSDIIRNQGIDRFGKLWYWYPKPVSPVFRPMKVAIKYDICIGASRVFDKKGQYRVFNAVVAYEKLFGIKLRCVMPGCFMYHQQKTALMRAELPRYPHVEPLPLVPRPVLAKLFNQSLIATHTCGGGHGDRAPLEAGACGRPLVLAATRRHAEFVFNDPQITFVPTDVDDAESFARGLKPWIEASTPERRKYVAEHFRRHASVESGSGPRMKTLFDFFRAHPDADRSLFIDIPLEAISR